MNLELCDPDAEAIVVAYFLFAPADLRLVRGALQPRDYVVSWTRQALHQLLRGVARPAVVAALNAFQLDALVLVGEREVAVTLARYLHELARRRRTVLAHQQRVDLARAHVAESLLAGRPLSAPQVAAWNDAVGRGCP